MIAAKMAASGGLGGNGLPAFPYMIDFSTLANGAMPAPFSGANWAISSGALINTPTIGSNLLTDPGMENWTTVTDLTSWTDTASNRDNANQRSGSYCNRLDISAGNAGASFSQNPLQSIGTWLYGSIYTKASIAGKTGKLTYFNTMISSGGTSYEKLELTSRAISSQTFALDRVSAASSSLYFDDAFLGQITPATMFATALWPTANIRLIAEFTLTPGMQCGLVTHLDNPSNPQNFLLWYYNQWNGGQNLNLVQCLNGTYTTPIQVTNSGSTAYTANGPIEARVVGTTAQLFYRGIQIGTDQTIDASLTANRYHGLFSTNPGNSFRAFYIGDPAHVWTRQGTAITGTAGGYKQSWAQEPTTLYDNGVFRMWYSSGSATRTISNATSADGLTNWTDYAGNPVTASGVTRSSVMKVGSIYYMFVLASGNLARYTSSDGLAWTQTHANVLPAGSAGAWDETGIANNFILIDGGVWKMFYESHSAKWWVGLATSTDLGITWVKDGANPIMGGGAASYSAPWTIKVGDFYYAWYHGHPSAVLPTDIYLLRSVDLHTWERCINGFFPRLGAGEGEGNASGQVADPVLVEKDGVTYIWYDAITNQTGSNIGQATAAVPIAALVR